MSEYNALREPCRACPFRRRSARGWLGPWSALDLLGTITCQPFPCHLTIKTGMDQDDDRLRGCAGAAIYLNNDLALSRDRRTMQHQLSLKDVDPDVSDGVFSGRLEFLEHHEPGYGEEEDGDECFVCDRECRDEEGSRTPGGTFICWDCQDAAEDAVGRQV